MNRLINIGFQCAGHWELVDSSLALVVERYARSTNVLYAFVSDGIVKYIGKTTQQFKVRMQGYITPGRNQTTNIRNNEKIIRLLQDGVAVDIFVLPDNGLLHYGDFHINLAAGLEDSLISVINPDWNGGKGSEIKVVEESKYLTDQGMFLYENRVTFDQVLEKTYYKSGFFNVKSEFSDLFGGDGDTIEIYVYSSNEPILGYINRTANKNGSPRIMGGVELRDWFQKNLNEMDLVKVQVISPVSIHIRAANG